jgi:hypothetical protein
MLVREGSLASRCREARDTLEPEVWADIEREVGGASAKELDAYLAGAMHDGTVSWLHNTVRIAQSDLNWLQVLGRVFECLGARRWFYQEGRRENYVVESSYIPVKGRLVSKGEKVAYVRGYFDAEGGLPRDESARFYIQFCQKDKADLADVGEVLESLGIVIGTLHNPSKRVDPHYWRFFIRSQSFNRFISGIRSWHPRKRHLLEVRGR